jgi:hypothetical protein
MRLNKSITIIERITKPFSKYSYLSVIDYQMFGYFFNQKCPPPNCDQLAAVYLLLSVSRLKSNNVKINI